MNSMINKEELQQLYRYGCMLTNDEHNSYDLLHDAIEICLRKPPDTSSLGAYVRKIMRNRFIDSVRKANRFPEISIEHKDVPMDIDSSLLEDVIINQQELNAVWDYLDIVERELLFLWAVEGYSAREIAEMMDIPRGTVLARIHRLRVRLKDNFYANEVASGGNIL